MSRAKWDALRIGSLIRFHGRPYRVSFVHNSETLSAHTVKRKVLRYKYLRWEDASSRRWQSADCIVPDFAGLSPQEFATRMNNLTPEQIATAMESMPTATLEAGGRFEALAHSSPVKDSLTTAGDVAVRGIE